MEDKQRVLLAVLGLLALTAIAYLPIWQAGWIWDDDLYVTENELLRDVEGLARIWFEPSATPQYYPLVHTSFWVEYQSWGLKPLGYHLVNVLLHAINAILLFLLLRRLQVPGAWIAAAIFAVHPVHVESVAWITERKNVLSGAFYLLSALAFFRFSEEADDPRTSNGRGLRAYLASLTLFVAALLSKTVTATLPVALGLVLWWKRGRLGRRETHGLVIMTLIGAGFGLYTAWWERTDVGASGPLWDMSPAERTLIAGRVVWFYLGKILAPVNLSFNYPRWEISAVDPWAWIWPVTAGLSLAGLWLLRGRIGRGAFAAAAFFVVTLGPALGFLNVYPFRYSFVADHFQYVASLGPIVGIAALCWGKTGVMGRRKRIVSVVVAVALVGLLAILTNQRSRAYRDLETLWTATIERNPASWLAHNNLGNLRLNDGRPAEAEEHFLIALANAPTHEPTHLNARNNLGLALLSQGRVEEGINQLEEVLRLDPTFKSAHSNLGAALSLIGRHEEAIAHLRAALGQDPGNEILRANLELALERSRTDR